MIFEKEIVKEYKKTMYSRCDDSGTVFYFSSDDFNGLKKEKYSFKSSLGHMLSGYVYSYDNENACRLVIFDHGMGGGHQAYMKEIEMLAARGYTVLAYDHTGCMESGGDSTNGFAQSLADLNDCVLSVKASERFKGTKIAVMGHSWGAFSTLNITALHPDITHIVAMCGFVSVKETVNAFFPGLLKGYRKPVLELERESNPVFSTYDAVASLKNSEVKALLIYSDNDKLCKRKHYDILKAELSDKDNVKFLLVKGKGHNPNYTEEAVKYLESFVKARAKLHRRKKLTPEDKLRFVSSYDFEKMTEQDESVWEQIFEHLEG